MTRPWRVFLIVTLLGWLVHPAMPVAGGAPVDEPLLELSTSRGLCNTRVIVRGTDFTPGVALRFTSRQEGLPDEQATVFAQATVGNDGTVEVVADLARLIAGCTGAGAAAGQQYRLSARDAGTDALLAFALFTVAPLPAPSPVLALEPASGPCATPEPPVVARGANAPPGVTVLLDVRAGADGAPTTFPGGTVAGNGTFTASLRLTGCGPETPAGTVFTVIVYTNDLPAEGPGYLLGEATFTVTTNDAGELCFAETNRCIAGRFLARWRASGGLAINGYPLSGEFEQRLEDGQRYLVQYFERTRLEYHPGNRPPEDVQLGQFGRRILMEVPGAPTAPVGARAGAVYFRETGHNVAPDFFAFWEANGGLAQFGYPLTEEFSQRLEDGQEYTVQYFERARFERHPENAPPYDLLLGQFGRRILAESGAAGAVAPALPGAMRPVRPAAGTTGTAPGGRAATPPITERVLVAGGAERAYRRRRYSGARPFVDDSRGTG
ncbi:MAG: hypothetical protein AVDCRST_MAG88-1864 [uncultured Thermomicrobiales bacterium]|uniref:Uncharacterized protein n=1 Tax=uncultured Thermomicrobiales bacterium TaxID=1645740 RepID=A0A6J4V650_9BACT|nr:MAG: hypothetical protein AVDCRST_MAG88-1864 [uncultured Thermomicrobiales bacterium]